MLLPFFKALVGRDDDPDDPEECTGRSKIIDDLSDCDGIPVVVIVLLSIVGTFAVLALYMWLDKLCRRRTSRARRAQPVDNTEVELGPSPVDPYGQMSITLDESLVEKVDSYYGPAIPEPIHAASPPPSYHRGSRESVRIPEGPCHPDSDPSCEPEEEPSPIYPPSLVHPVN